MPALPRLTSAALLALGLAAATVPALAADDAAPTKPKATSKLGECSHAAKEKGLKGDARKASIKECMAAGKTDKAAPAKASAS
ncbi:PsiF family protein [Derxia gummosa]|uniref:PsiF family protein n=1 Tax=Derxia gummosa DSM 723 TaxID=1121388 RepID=A0A8B6X8L2_9BURK|nr:PsiF family protein [Derxia gummosa]